MALAAMRHGPAAALAVLAIRGYQRWLSPLKGFRCAHSVRHGGPGCSGYAVAAIGAHGLFGAIGPVRQRFRDCRAAYDVLKSEQQEGEPGEDGGKGADKAGVAGGVCASLGAPCDASLPGASACGIGGEGAGTACSACNLGSISCCS